MHQGILVVLAVPIQLHTLAHPHLCQCHLSSVPSAEPSLGHSTLCISLTSLQNSSP